MGPGGALLALWLPTLLIAHAFAAGWLWRAWKLMRGRAAAPGRHHKAMPLYVHTGTTVPVHSPLARGLASPESKPRLVHAVALPPPPHDPQSSVLLLEWTTVSCSYSTPGGKVRHVLANVSGCVAASELHALLGPSGAGKSSLLDVLAGRKTTGRLAGTVRLDGMQLRGTAAAAAAGMAYMPQDDHFIPVMTCYEVLAFHASLQLGHHLQVAREAAAPPVLHDALAAVGLLQHADTLVGGALPGGLVLRGLSGGERRRLSLAVALLGSPCGLLADEPTSGLDAYAALSVAESLRSLTRRGRIVVAAVHQPRSAVWGLFDTVTLLASGLLVYHGPTAGLVPWLSGELGYVYDPALHGLASDWALDLVTVEFEKPQVVTICAPICTCMYAILSVQQVLCIVHFTFTLNCKCL
jgi:ABC-type multidrug transport system ATPase subunit